MEKLNSVRVWSIFYQKPTWLLCLLISVKSKNVPEKSRVCHKVLHHLTFSPPPPSRIQCNRVKSAIGQWDRNGDCWVKGIPKVLYTSTNLAFLCHAASSLQKSLREKCQFRDRLKEEVGGCENLASSRYIYIYQSINQSKK